MALFEPIELTWKGLTYKIPSGRVLKAVAKVEEIITLSLMSTAAQAGSVPVAKVAMAYGSVLRFAGAVVEDEEVYEAMMSGGTDGQSTMQLVNGLLVIMIPKRLQQKLEAKMKEEENAAQAQIEGNGS